MQSKVFLTGKTMIEDMGVPVTLNGIVLIIETKDNINVCGAKLIVPMEIDNVETFKLIEARTLLIDSDKGFNDDLVDDSIEYLKGYNNDLDGVIEVPNYSK